MGLLAHKQPKNFWLGERNGVQNRFNWANITKRELKKDRAYFDQVIFSHECVTMIAAVRFSIFEGHKKF